MAGFRTPIGRRGAIETTGRPKLAQRSADLQLRNLRETVA
jgi:hypothetical protein